MKESELHKHINARSQGLTLRAPWTLGIGPGDDAAVVHDDHGRTLVVTVDQLVEGRHYKPDTDLDLIARKAVARSVSDIAAMGAAPIWTTVTALLAPGDTTANELFDHVKHWGDRFGCPIIGGDIATHNEPSLPRVLTTTVVGELEPGHQPVTRAGAKPGDLVYLTGQIGGSFDSGWHLRFEPRITHGRWASSNGSGVHAMIDLSDGLGRDAARIGQRSNLVLELEAAKLPISHRCASWRDAASEGEDYELLMCIDPSAQIPTLEPELIGPVGVCRETRGTESPGAIILDPYGTPHDASALGWEHDAS